MSKNPKPRCHWLLFALFAYGYFAFGQLLSGLSSQSQVVPIWLPSGIALVGAYIWGWRFFPAVFFASASFNFYSHPEARFADLLSPLGWEVSLIALGATLQAAVGSSLLKHWIGNPLSLRSDIRAIGFIFGVGLLVNLISSNIGVYALSVFNPNYSIDNYWSNVLHWWLGDSLGVLLGTPFLLGLFKLRKLDEQGAKARALILSASALLFVSVTITTSFFSRNSYQSAVELAQREFRVMENGIHRQINNSLAQVHNLASFLQNNPQVSRESFHHYVNTLLSSQETIRAMSWNPVIPSDQQKAYEATLSAIYDRPIKIKGMPIEPDDPMVVVEFISPENGNEQAIGFNVYSNAKRKSVLSSDALRYRPMATPIIKLIQSNTAEPGYLLFAPVYRLTAAHNFDDTPIKKLTGFATGVFLVKQMLNQAVDPNQGKIFDYELYEVDSTKAFLSNTGTNDLILSQNPLAITAGFDVSGQTWLLTAVPKSEFLNQYQSQLALILFIFQVVVVAFVMLLILLMNNRRVVLGYMVKDRTIDLEAAKKSSDEANLAKSRFLANMSHEIRTPLNAVIGFSQLAKQTKDPQTLTSYIDKIELSSNTLLSLVNDILDISKIESEKLSLERIPFDMHQLIKRIDAMFETSAKNKNLTWTIHSQLPKNLWYVGDPVRIEQILINLCANAIKFTSKGGVSLSVDLMTQDDSTARLRYAIKDSGIGISPEVIDNLFNAFTQADSSTSRQFGGTGLGLAISKELSQLMNGDISVSSEPGKGSLFVCELVLDTTTTPPPERIDALKNHDFSGLRVLVAEDNAVNQIVIDEMLKSLSITPEVVHNGEEALSAVQEREFDLVLMDCQMPVMDGYETTTAIRQIPELKHLPIIALTADVMPEDKAHALDVGFNGHLAKPLDMDKLVECLTQHRP